LGKRVVFYQLGVTVGTVLFVTLVFSEKSIRTIPRDRSRREERQ